MRDNDRTRALALAFAAALTLAACGGSSAGDSTHTQAAAAPKSGSQAAPPPRRRLPRGLHRASPAAVAVINGWADTLRAGHPVKAAGYFSVPVVVENGGPLMRLDTEVGVIAFNRSLPCGAHLVQTVAGALYVVATFVLTERPGSPGCTGTGKLAATAFLIRHGKIAEWRRVLVPPPLGDAKNVQPAQPLI